MIVEVLRRVYSKKYRYQAIKQKEQSKLKIKKTSQLHEIRTQMTGQHEPL